MHGDSIPVREALILASATQKYKIPDLRRRLGEDERDIKDKLLLVQDEDAFKKTMESLGAEHLVEMDFVVDMDPAENAQSFTKKMTALAKQIGARVVDTKYRPAKGKETVMVVTFNVSNTQKNVVDSAINGIMKAEQVTKARALEFVCAEFLASADLLTKKSKRYGNKN